MLNIGRPANILTKTLLPGSLPHIVLCSGLFNWVAGMGSGPVKGFNSPEVQQIIQKKHDPNQNKIAKEEAQTATFAAGCFWGVQLAFQRVPGVVTSMVGYTAGPSQNPTYKDVCSGSSGHTEAVQMLFNPAVVSYAELLTVLFDRMDPTTLNRQGNDRGTQYRSGIYYHNEDQKNIAANFIKEIQPRYKEPIVVEVKEASKFWPAEDYHQKYLEKGSQKAAKGCLDPIKCYG